MAGGAPVEDALAAPQSQSQLPPAFDQLKAEPSAAAHSAQAPRERELYVQQLPPGCAAETREDKALGAYMGFLLSPGVKWLVLLVWVGAAVAGIVAFTQGASGRPNASSHPAQGSRS